MNRRESIIERIVRRTLVDEATGCWIWQGPTSGNGRGGGYPRMCLDGQTVAVHRAMFVCVHGYVPGKRQIDHDCRNRMCVNPDHLLNLTHKQNQRKRDRARREVDKLSR